MKQSINKVDPDITSVSTIFITFLCLSHLFKLILRLINYISIISIQKSRQKGYVSSIALTTEDTPSIIPSFEYRHHLQDDCHEFTPNRNISVYAMIDAPNDMLGHQMPGGRT